ncbi:MAG: phospho-N-acetylmuramoyl-pentapeptide-transferase [Campylobacteraceae bacterium]|nr:phospho-N-acetylmuramoyl-pentapeptide-transferase [Campylobacteraceae bacterium]
MLYWLYKLTSINLFQYITVRAGIAFFIAFISCVVLLPRFIKWAKKTKTSQPIYDLAPKSHKQKSNTPTMGGVVFISTAIISSLICARLDNMYILSALFCIIGFSLIGFKDDFSKIKGGSNQDGLSPRAKLFLQIFVAFFVSLFLFNSHGMSGDFYFPFYKKSLFDMGVFSIAFWTLVIISSSNAVNLTDGLDGLATVPSIFALMSLSVFVYVIGNANLSTYLIFPKNIGVGEVVIIASALIGSLIGFLWYNCYPAEVFMGDSGSLSMGAFIGYMAIISKNELLLIIVGFVFVLETVSVILQVGSFKARKKRIFLMAPIHHHFEIKGWAENKIIVRFWILALLSNIIALTALKIR